MKAVAPILGGVIGATAGFFLSYVIFVTMLEWGANLFVLVLMAAGWMLGYRRYAPRRKPGGEAPDAARQESALSASRIRRPPGRRMDPVAVECRRWSCGERARR